VWSTAKARYAALSHVWEAPSRLFEARLDNLSTLLQKGGLRKVGEQDGFPNSVARAMEFAAQMALRYLWVDRYCIVQDDLDH